MGAAISGSSTSFKPARPSFVPSRPDRYYQFKRYDKFRDLPDSDQPIWAIAVADQRGLVAASTADNKVYLWNMMTQELIATLTAHTGPVWCVQFSPNEMILATASSDSTIRLWESATGLPVTSLRGHSDCVRCLAFSPRDVLLSGSCDETLCLWQPDNATPCKKWVAHEGDIIVVAFVETDPDLGMSLGADGSIAVWRVLDGANGLVARFPGGDGSGVLSLSCHPLLNGVVATGCPDGAVWLWFWQAGTGKDCITGHQHLRGHAQAVWAVSFSSSGSVLASASNDCKIRVWSTVDLRSPHLLSVFVAHDAWVRCLCWRKVVVAHEWEQREVHNDAGELVVEEVKVPILKPNAELVSASVDGKLSFWKTPKQIRNLACAPPALAGGAEAASEAVDNNSSSAGATNLASLQDSNARSSAGGAEPWASQRQQGPALGAGTSSYRVSPSPGGEQRAIMNEPLFGERSAEDIATLKPPPPPAMYKGEPYAPPSRT